MDKLRLNESESEPDVNEPSGVMGAVGAFLKQHGVATLFACVLLYYVLYEGRLQASQVLDQIKDMNAQMLRLSGLLSDHHTEGKENTRLLLAQCLNQAESSEERDRCLGFR